MGNNECDNERECPVCGALIDVSNEPITFESFECHDCETMLEYGDGCLIKI